jgi:phytoene synthase
VSVTTVDLREAYDYCQAVTKREARNFYFAFITLPRRRRRAIYAVYAFARLADDIADGTASDASKAEQLRTLRGDLQAAFDDDPRGPVFIALVDAAREYGVEQALFAQLIDGVEMDLTPRRYRTFDELRGYCYHVASVVGLISIEIFGYRDPRARDAAIDLGLAMQLTNIMRDVREDADAGRVYLPIDELERFGYSEADLTHRVVNDRFVELMRFQAERARGYFDSGSTLLDYLSPRSRACPAVLHGLYSKLLDRMAERGFRVFSERTRLSSAEKLKLTAKLWAMSLIPRHRTWRRRSR